MIGLRSCPVRFKEVFTEKTLQIQVNQFFTVTQMFETYIPMLSTEFGINQNDIEIAVAGRQVGGYLPEESPPLNPTSRRLCDIWGPDIKDLSFYVRNKTCVYPKIAKQKKEREENIVNVDKTLSLGDCPICLEFTATPRRYECCHGVCSLCYDRCKEMSITRCSLCRSV